MVLDGLLEEAREGVRSAARRERDDDFDGAARIAGPVLIIVTGGEEHGGDRREERDPEAGTGAGTGRGSSTPCQFVAKLHVLRHNDSPPECPYRVVKSPPPAVRLKKALPSYAFSPDPYTFPFPFPFP